jgi:triacylglycerol esterase/lipase EstA (alpha/beta hydrolase family)
VILVPGYGGDEQMLAKLAARLQRAGRTTVTLALPNDATGDLRGQEHVLAAQVAAELKRGAASVDLVGYSAGGIVVALFVAAEPSHVRRVVTLGSPLHGTRLAGLAAGLVPSACPTACEQMVPGSPLLASLGAAAPTSTGVPWLALWTSQDQVVTPPDSARFDGATNVELQTVCADDAATHVSLPEDPLADGLTVRALDSPGLPLASASASDCAALRALGS